LEISSANQVISQPTLIDVDLYPFIQIVAGTSHSLALTLTKSILVAGSNQLFQLDKTCKGKPS
jgi:alpha-tubulin suppressor-like RCC1 family protein